MNGPLTQQTTEEFKGTGVLCCVQKYQVNMIQNANISNINGTLEDATQAIHFKATTLIALLILQVFFFYLGQMKIRSV